MKDAIDLSRVVIHNSPDVRDWPATVRITDVLETAAGGFTLAFDHPLPDAWKWPSNPAEPSENYQFTVWMLVNLAGIWHAAGFVQMWQGRPMGTGTLPAIFADDDGVPGYVNWWGDRRGLWGGELANYTPKPGDVIGFMVTAGNARLTSGVTSVPERSNIVLFQLVTDDHGRMSYPDNAPPTSPPPDTGPMLPPPFPMPVPPDADHAALLSHLAEVALAIGDLASRIITLEERAAPVYRTSLFGAAVVLKPDPVKR